MISFVFDPRQSLWRQHLALFGYFRPCRVHRSVAVRKRVGWWNPDFALARSRAMHATRAWTGRRLTVTAGAAGGPPAGTPGTRPTPQQGQTTCVCRWNDIILHTYVWVMWPTTNTVRTELHAILSVRWKRVERNTRIDRQDFIRIESKNTRFSLSHTHISTHTRAQTYASASVYINSAFKSCNVQAGRGDERPLMLTTRKQPRPQKGPSPQQRRHFRENADDRRVKGRIR